MNVGFVRTDGSCVGLMLCLLFGRKSGRELCSVVGLRFELDFFFVMVLGGCHRKEELQFTIQLQFQIYWNKKKQTRRLIYKTSDTTQC